MGGVFNLVHIDLEQSSFQQSITEKYNFERVTFMCCSVKFYVLHMVVK